MWKTLKCRCGISQGEKVQKVKKFRAATQFLHGDLLCCSSRELCPPSGHTKHEWQTKISTNTVTSASIRQTVSTVCVCVCVCWEKYSPPCSRCVEVDTSARLRSSSRLNINTIRLKPLGWHQDCCQGYIWKKKHCAGLLVQWLISAEAACVNSHTQNGQFN